MRFLFISNALATGSSIRLSTHPSCPIHTQTYPSQFHLPFPRSVCSLTSLRKNIDYLQNRNSIVRFSSNPSTAEPFFFFSFFQMSRPHTSSLFHNCTQVTSFHHHHHGFVSFLLLDIHHGCARKTGTMSQKKFMSVSLLNTQPPEFSSIHHQPQLAPQHIQSFTKPEIRNASISHLYQVSPPPTCTHQNGAQQHRCEVSWIRACLATRHG